MTIPVPPEGRIAPPFDDLDRWELQCPECWCWGEIDDDQLHGRISTDHSHMGSIGRSGSPVEGRECEFHQTRDWFTTAERNVR